MKKVDRKLIMLHLLTTRVLCVREQDTVSNILDSVVRADSVHLGRTLGYPCCGVQVSSGVSAFFGSNDRVHSFPHSCFAMTNRKQLLFFFMKCELIWP